MKICYSCALILLLLGGCRQEVKRVFSPDRKQCITIFNLDGIRYIIAGNVESIPKSNYIKLRTNQMTAQNDEFAGCWNREGYKWLGFIQGADILENTLDPTLYKFSNILPVDSIMGIPDYKPFSDHNCFHFGFSRFVVTPKGHAIIE